MLYICNLNSQPNSRLLDVIVIRICWYIFIIKLHNNIIFINFICIYSVASKRLFLYNLKKLNNHE